MEILFFILQVLLCYFIVVNIHEIGHIIVGVLSGFQFQLLVIGPIGLKRNDNGKIVFYFEKSPALWGGASAAMPINEDENNFNKFANVLIGGPLASLIFGVIVLVLFSSKSDIFGVLLGIMSISISVSTLIPARAGCFYSDGGRWLRIKRKGYDAQVEIAIFKLVQSYSVNNSYLKLDIKDAKLLIEDNDTRNRYIGHYFAYRYYKDNGDMVSAEKELVQMESLKSDVPKNFPKLLSTEK